ncbi:restriction endonuclease [Parafrankia sp. EAN1pec]|nr:restriction endonuclease [Frankia sp. EAN1pec]
MWQPLLFTVVLGTAVVLVGWLPLLLVAVLVLGRRAGLARASFERRQRERHNEALAGIDDKSSPELSRFVATLLTRDGCVDAEVIPLGGRHGLDVLATTSAGERIAVACHRHTGETTISPNLIRRFRSHLLDRYHTPPTTAVIVTSGRLTDPARVYAEEHGVVVVERHRLGLWALGSPPPVRGLRARTLPAGASRADHPLPTRASERVLWLTPVPTLVVLCTAGLGPALLFLAVALATATLTAGADAHFDPEPPPLRWPWWPLWAEASAKPAAAALAATILLALHAQAG